MTKISKEELLKLARISQLTIDENEIELLSKQIQDVLSYAARVKEGAQTVVTNQLPKNSNVFRKDKSRSCEAGIILALAPDRQDNYFVVPKIIESK